jgi:cysteine synthase
MTTSPSVLDHIGNTPLVRLERLGAGLPVPVLGKCEFLDSGGSVKDRLAVAIVDDAQRRGLLRPALPARRFLVRESNVTARR